MRTIKAVVVNEINKYGVEEVSLAPPQVSRASPAARFWVRELTATGSLASREMKGCSITARCERGMMELRAWLRWSCRIDSIPAPVPWGARGQAGEKRW